MPTDLQWLSAASIRTSRRLIQSALDHELTLIAYEADLSQRPPHRERLSREETSWREAEQARNLGEALGRLPEDTKLLIWCGNGHLTKQPVQDWLPMGYRFEQLLGIEPFTIDQIATVEFDSAPRRPWADWALQFAPLLVSLGGTAGFLAEEASPDWPARRQNGRLPAVDRQRS